MSKVKLLKAKVQEWSKGHMSQIDDTLSKYCHLAIE